MKIDLKNGIGSLTDFARNTREQTDELIRTGRPKVLTQNGSAALLVLSVDAFEELSSQAYKRQMDMRLKESLDRLVAGEKNIDRQGCPIAHQQTDKSAPIKKIVSFGLRYSLDAEKCIDEQLQWFEESIEAEGSAIADHWLENLPASVEHLGNGATSSPIGRSSS